MTLLDLTPRVATNDRLAALPVAIIGAGPIGLAAAANLLERGIDFVMYDAGENVASNVRQWGHTRLFSPWRHLVDPAARRLLEANGWSAPGDDLAPFGHELVDQYLGPLASLDPIASRTRTGVEVLAVSREGMDRTRTARRSATPFVLRLRDAHGVVSEVTARAVIDASGTYRNPNALALSGLDPLGAEEVAAHLTHALPNVLGRDRDRFAGRNVTVVGAGHSAANTLIALAALAREVPGTTVTWLIRNDSAVRVSSSPEDELAARAQIGGQLDGLVVSGHVQQLDGFEIIRLAARPDGVRVIGTRHGAIVEHDTDIVVNATGFRPDLDMLREMRLDLDEIVEAPRRLAPLIDPNLHSCGTVEPHDFRELTHPEHGFFIVGMKSYGRAPTFLLATGHEQVRSVSAWLAGDMAAASKVELVLPSTGVCSTEIPGDASCCS